MKEQIPASNISEVQIRNHEIGLSFVQSFQRLLAVHGGNDVPVFKRKCARKTDEHTGIIVDQKNCRLIKGSLSQPRRTRFRGSVPQSGGPGLRSGVAEG